MSNFFVICPLGAEDSDDRKRSNRLLEYIIKPAIADVGTSVLPF